MKQKTFNFLYIVLLTVLVLLVSCKNTAQVNDSIVLGAVLPLSGPNVFYGEFTKYGIDLAVDDINANGGINGKQFRVIYEDSGADTQKAVSGAKKLIDLDKVDALMTTSTPLSGALSPIAEENQIPMIYQSATNSFAEKSTFVFKDYPDAEDICRLLMKKAIERGHKDISLIGINTEFTQLCKKGAESIGKLKSFEAYAPGSADLKQELTKLKSTDSTALLLITFNKDCLTIYKNLRDIDYNPEMYIGFSGFGCGSKEATLSGKDLLKNSFGGDLALEESSKDLEFMFLKKRLEEKDQDLQIVGSAMVYDDVMMLAKSFSGCKDSICVTNNLRSLQDYDGVSGKLGFDGRQIIRRDIMLVQFDGEKWERVE